MAEVLNFFNDVFRVKEAYCVICMRTGRQRRLVTNSTHLKDFISSICIQNKFDDEFQKICFLCERQAAAAFKFRCKMSIVCSINNTYNILKSNERQYKQMRKKVEEGLLDCSMARNIVEWEKLVKEFRADSRLLQTDVLHVGSDPDPLKCEDLFVIQETVPAASPPCSPAPAPAPSPSPPPECPRPPAPASSQPPHQILPEPEIYMQSVVIIDEEEDPIDIKHELHRTDNPTDHIYPQTTPTLLPSVQPQMAANTALVPLETFLNNPKTTQAAFVTQKIITQDPNEPSNFLLHPIIETEGYLSVPTLGAKILDGKLVTPNSTEQEALNIALQDGANINILTDQTEVNGVLKNLYSKSNLTLNDMRVIINDSEVIDQNSGLRTMECGMSMNNNILGKYPTMVSSFKRAVDNTSISISNVGTCRQSKERRMSSDGLTTDNVPKKSSTDWEDKIPMDVISFMDATDPNASPMLSGLDDNINPPVTAPAPPSLLPSEPIKTPYLIVDGQTPSATRSSVAPSISNVGRQVRRVNTRSTRSKSVQATHAEEIIDLC